MKSLDTTKVIDERKTKLAELNIYPSLDGAGFTSSRQLHACPIDGGILILSGHTSATSESPRYKHKTCLTCETKYKIPEG